jgi:hypothetical protein
VRSVLRVVFAPEDSCYTGAEAAQYFTIRIDHIPLAVEIFFLDGPCFITQCIHSNRILVLI